MDVDDFVGSPQEVIGNCLTHAHTGSARYRIVQRFEMLDVDRRYDGDAGVQQVDYVFVALAVFRTRNVRVGQLIDDGDGGAPRYHRIEIHLFDHDTFVLDAAHGNAFQITNQRP